VSSAKAIDKIPSLKEQGYNVELANWRGIFGAPGITKAQQAELVKVIEMATKHKSWEESLKKQDWTNFWLPGDEYGAFVQSEIKRIGDILAGLNLGKK
jgi:putative tricarboxylic transport membrane protein